MSRLSEAVDPSSSPWHLLGAGLRHWREHRGLTLQALAPMVLTSYSALSKFERAERTPTTDVVERLDEVLQAGGFLVSLHAAVAQNDVPGSGDSSSQWDADAMDQLRRRLLGGIAAAGAAAAVPLDELESLRSIVDKSVGRPRITEWEERAWEYAHLVFSPDISEVIRDLSVDMLALQQCMTSMSPVEANRWLLVNTQMTTLLAYALGCAGQSRESHHWWHSAERAAKQTGDDELLASVYSREAVQALHEERPLLLVLSRATRVLELTQGCPSVATSSALGARAHALALIGNVSDAYADLAEQARIFDHLPASVTTDRASVDGWPDTRVLYSRSLVYTITGHRDVDAAHQETINAFPREPSRQRAQVELHRAYTEVQRGHIDSGISHARAVLSRMNPHHINRFVLHNATSISTVVPVMEQTRPAVTEYRELLALPDYERT